MSTEYDFDKVVDLRIQNALRERGSVLTIGNFDGVHRGHQTLLRDVCASARERSAAAVAMTFEPHPAALFGERPQEEFRITSAAERETLLKHYGVDEVLTVPFTRSFSDVPPESFVRDLLFERLNVVEVHIGYDFAFGRGRRGNTESLQALCGERGVDVVVHRALTSDNEPISSTLVRDCLRRGAVDEARRLMGHYYAITGVSGRGAQRGREMAIPTINQYPSGRMLPRAGVYATWIRVGDSRWLPAISNLGARPTFDDGDARISLETHVLASMPELSGYGAPVALSFIEFIRDERRFETAEALGAQIGKDVAIASKAHNAVLADVQGQHDGSTFVLPAIVPRRSAHN